MFWNFWATEFNVRSRGWLDMVAPACNFRVQEAKAGGGSRSKNLSQRTKTSKNLPKLTLFLDSNGIRSWGVLIFLLGFFVPAPLALLQRLLIAGSFTRSLHLGPV